MTQDKKHKVRMGTSKTIIDNGKLIRVNTAKLRMKYKNFSNVNDKYNNETTQLVAPLNILLLPAVVDI